MIIVDVNKAHDMHMEMNVDEALRMIEHLSRMVREKTVGLPTALHAFSCVAQVNGKDVPSRIVFHVLEK